MIIQELAAKLGLEIDEGAFATGAAIVEKLSKGLLGIGAALGAYAGGMQALIQSTSNAAFATAKAAQATGLSTDAIQELTEAADDSGLSAEQLQGGLRRLARAAYDASQGSTEASDTFADLGVSIYDSAGKLKAPDALLQDIATKFESMPDGMRKAALAQRAFGKSGAELLIFLNKGGAAIGAARQEAHDFGTVLSGETLAAAETYRLANDALGDSVRGLGYMIAGPLLQGAGDLAQALADLIKNNRKLIASIVRRPFEFMRDVFKWMAKHLTVVKVAVSTLTLYMVGAHIPAVWASVAAWLALQWEIRAVTFWMGLAKIAALAASAAATLGWLALAAAIVLVAEDLYTFATGGKSLIGEFGTEWMKFLDEKLGHKPDDNGAIWFLKEFGKNLFDMQGAVIKIGRAWDEFKESVRLTLELLRPLWGLLKTEAIGAVRVAMVNLFGKPPPAVGEAAASGIFDPMQSVWSPAAQSPTAAAASAGAGASGGNSTRVQAQISVTVPPGSDAARVGQEVSNAWDEWWNNELQQSIPAVAPER